VTVNVNDAGVWKAAVPYVNDTGVWKPVVECWVKDGAVWKLSFASVVTIFVPTDSDTVEAISPATATATVTFDNTGAYTIGDDSGGSWMIGLGGVAADYEIRWTNTSGTLSTGTVGAWLNLGTSRSWDVSRSGVGGKSCTGTVEIRRASDSVVLATGSIAITATVTS
jgi:hypothetical protein